MCTFLFCPVSPYFWITQFPFGQHLPFLRQTELRKLSTPHRLDLLLGQMQLCISTTEHYRETSRSHLLWVSFQGFILAQTLNLKEVDQKLCILEGSLSCHHFHGLLLNFQKHQGIQSISSPTPDCPLPVSSPPQTLKSNLWTTLNDKKFTFNAFFSQILASWATESWVEWSPWDTEFWVEWILIMQFNY